MDDSASILSLVSLIVGLLAVGIIPNHYLYLLITLGSGYMLFTTRSGLLHDILLGIFPGMCILGVFIINTFLSNQRKCNIGSDKILDLTFPKHYQTFHQDFFRQAIIPLLKLVGLAPSHPPEIQICLAELELLKEDSSISSAAYKVVAPTVRDMLLNKHRMLATIQDSGVNPKQLTLLLISNVCSDLLTSGSYHVYRGMLSMSGSDVRNLFVYANKELVKCGFHSQEQCDDNLSWIKDEIRNLG